MRFKLTRTQIPILWPLLLTVLLTKQDGVLKKIESLLPVLACRKTHPSCNKRGAALNFCDILRSCRDSSDGVAVVADHTEEKTMRQRLQYYMIEFRPILTN